MSYDYLYIRITENVLECWLVKRNDNSYSVVVAEVRADTVKLLIVSLLILINTWACGMPTTLNDEQFISFCRYSSSAYRNCHPHTTSSVKCWRSNTALCCRSSGPKLVFEVTTCGRRRLASQLKLLVFQSTCTACWWSCRVLHLFFDTEFALCISRAFLSAHAAAVPALCIHRRPCLFKL